MAFIGLATRFGYQIAVERRRLPREKLNLSNHRLSSLSHMYKNIAMAIDRLRITIGRKKQRNRNHPSIRRLFKKYMAGKILDERNKILQEVSPVGIDIPAMADYWGSVSTPESIAVP